MDQPERGLSVPQSQHTLAHGLSFSVANQLRAEGTFCDVVITAEGVEFSGHKNILCGCSSFFRALFTTWSGHDERIYSIPDVSSGMMRLFIEYAYTGRVPVTPENVEHLLAAADRFSIMGVVQACRDFLEARLRPENCISVWTLADVYYSRDLLHKAHLYILRHFEDVVRVSEEFLELSPPQLAALIERDDLNVKREEVVYDAVIRWVRHSAEERSAHLPLLLRKVRMALMSAEFFTNNVKNNALVQASRECEPVIAATLRAMNSLNKNTPSILDVSNPLARPRLPYAILLAIGGWKCGPQLNLIEAFDSRANRWVEVAGVEEEGLRVGHGTAYLNGSVYCVGGCGYMGFGYFNTVRRFDPATLTWHQVAPMHSRRCYVSVATLGGLIYAMGGTNGEHLCTAERYEPRTNQWTLMAPMHEKRSHTCATALHGKVYICGGFNYDHNRGHYLSSAECYSPEVDQWTMISPMSTPRYGVGVTTYHQQVYAVGGFDGANWLRTAEAYDPATDTWRPVCSMSAPRSDFGIAVVDDRLLVAGGHDGSTELSNVEWYDQSVDGWSDARDLGTHRYALSCCVVDGLPDVSQYVVHRPAGQERSAEEEEQGEEEEEGMLRRRRKEEEEEEEGGGGGGNAEEEEGGGGGNAEEEEGGGGGGNAEEEEEEGEEEEEAAASSQ